MTKTIFLPAVALLVAGGLGCSSTADDELVEARRHWLQTKPSCGSYHYQVLDSSFSGWQGTTTIAIAGDQPTNRIYSEGTRSGDGIGLVVTASWAETGTDIGSHAAGRAAKTMEQLYEDCRRDVLGKDRSKNMVMFQADQQGVLQQCWYVPYNCADDCATGIVVSNFACGPLPEEG